MNMLESPLEALAFNYATFGLSTILNNLWAWAAALSIWKIRPKSHCPPSTAETNSNRPLEACVPPEATGNSRPAVEASVDGLTKGKFTVYYQDEDECEKEEELLTETEEECKSEWWEDWDKMLRLRRGENGWYKYQDLTELNGNVVRLWDDAVRVCKRREPSYSSSCMYGHDGVVAS